MSITTGGGVTRSAFDVPAGFIGDFGHANDPGLSVGDWLECNGQNVSRTTYATLFGKIGIVHGPGDGFSTFTLPDARRRSRVGKGGVGTGTLGNAVGNTGGEETHTETGAESGLPNHSHTQNATDNIGATFTGPLQNGATSGNAVANANFGIVNAGPSNGSAQNVYHPVIVCGVWIKS